MNVMQINKYITLNGGSEVVMQSISDIFLGKGHKVINIGFSKINQTYILPNISLGKESKNIKRFFYDRKLSNALISIINSFNPDLIITHNIYHDFPHFQLLKAIKSVTNCKIITILHDSKPVCPIHTLLRNSKPCESCENQKFYKCIFHNCMNNVLFSTLVALDSYYNITLNKVYNLYDTVISPSYFLREQLIKNGFKHNKFNVCYNPVEKMIISPKEGLSSKRTVLYAGRLSEEKGIHILISAIKKISDINLIIAGTGPRENELRRHADNFENISFIGYIQKQELVQLFDKVDYLCIPSIWFENNPMIVLEALANGVPVLGSNIGGIPELVAGNGFIFEPNNIDSLINTLNIGFSISNDAYKTLSTNAINFSHTITYDKYYDMLIDML